MFYNYLLPLVYLCVLYILVDIRKGVHLVYGWTVFDGWTECRK